MTLNDHIIELTDLARQTGSYAYKFQYAKDYRDEVVERGFDPGDQLIEIRVMADGAVSVTPCDLRGHPVGGVHPFLPRPTSVGSGRGTSGGAPSYREELKEAVRPEVEAQVRAELAEPKKKWWKKS